ncbi:MAG: zeta toxin family protein, partial [Elusimicrobiaceae bacterium]|nr:zeta toxin family protein [Elusimicrobiaceae bacterium]
ILSDPIFDPYYAKDGTVYTHKQVLERLAQADKKHISTASQYRAFGANESASYRPERLAVHKEILSKMFANIENKVSETPTFIILGGRSGSGKSNVLKGAVYDTEHYLVINADDIKQMLPEYTGDNAFALHEESLDLIDEALNMAAKLHVNVVLEATMNDTRVLKRRLKMFGDAGYKTEAHYIFVPRQEAAKRVVKRFLNKPDARYVSPQVVLNQKNGEKNFNEIKDYVDVWTFSDNNVAVGETPTLIARKGRLSYTEGGKTWIGTEQESGLIFGTANYVKTPSFDYRKYVVPALGIGLVLTAAINSSAIPLLTLASFPFFGGISGIGSRSDISNLSPNVQKFVALRKSFDKELFRGNYLSVVEASNMKKIIGEDFYNRWMEYFEQDLADYARENPQSIEELIKYSNRYEATLPSQINYRFTGTNPLYVYTMKDATDNFEKDLLAGKTFKEAVMNMGKTMFLYHRKINQIRSLFVEQRESNTISWQYVRVPEGYHTVSHLNEKSAPSEFVGSKVKLKDTFVFGILEDAKPRIITPFDKDSYGEYYWDLINVTNRPNVFKGVNLTYPKTRNELMGMVYEDVMWHPLGVEDDGFNNVDAMFDAIQKDYDAIKPIIMRSRKGETLTENEVETLHNTISEISYLFTNAKPFYRGSASANLAIVYGLYEMAGINAPQVKMGKGLDLSAFITTPEQYRSIWKDLFADKFVIPNLAPKAQVKINKDEVSAQLLFSNWYVDKNLHIIINKQGHMYKNLPSDFVKGNFFYRGMNLSSYKDLEDIFTKGLAVNKTKEQDGIYFSGNPEYAVMYAQDFKWGHVPVFLKMAQPSDKHSDIVESFSDLKAEDIDEVLVWAYMQGKLGWWKAGL